MNDPFLNASRTLTDTQKKAALEYQLEYVNEIEGGIIRQLLGSENKPLSKKQEYIYRNKIEPTLVEKCGNSHCSEFVPAGDYYCGCCNIEYG